MKRVISIRRLREFWDEHPDAETPLREWYKVARKAEWQNLQDVRMTYPAADAVTADSGATMTVFNIRGNKYRLITSIWYGGRQIYIKCVLTHSEYSKEKWKKHLHMPRTKTTRPPGKLPSRFEDLVALLAPRAIQDEIDYENTIGMLDRLTSLPRLTKGQEQYLETLSVLVEAYESDHHAIGVDDLTPIQVLEHLLDANNMNASQLGELLGNRSLGSKILRGQRELSKSHIRLLAKRFGVEPGLFI